MKRSTAGFTLVEMLVVISIIAVIAALAFPAISGAIEKGKITQDMNNLRQLGIATQTYLNDNDNTYFVPSDNWMQKLHPTGAGTQYLPNYKIFKSPFDVGANRALSEDPTKAPISYGFNANAHGTSSGEPLQSDKITNPSVFILFAPAIGSGTTATFSGRADAPVTVNKSASSPGGSATGGTHNRRQRIDVCLSDLHIENMSWVTFINDSAKTGDENAAQRWDPVATVGP